MSLERCQEETTSANFLLWLAFLREEDRDKITRKEKEHYYLAQIACEVRRVLANKPNEIKTENFLLDFKVAGEDDETAKAKKARPAKSRRVFDGEEDEWTDDAGDDWEDGTATTPEPTFDRVAASKASWMAFCGLTGEKKTAKLPTAK